MNVLPLLPYPAVTAECLQTSVLCDNNDDDNVLTMLVHVSHAWLGGGGQILILNGYLPIIIIINADMMIATLWLLIFSLNHSTFHNRGSYDVIMTVNGRVVTQITLAGHLTIMAHVTVKSVQHNSILSLTSC